MNRIFSCRRVLCALLVLSMAFSLTGCFAPGDEQIKTEQPVVEAPAQNEESDTNEAPAQSEQAHKPEEASPTPSEPVAEPEPVTEPAAEPVPAKTRAELLLETMTLEEKVGQMFLAQYPYTDDGMKAAEFHLGGCLYFASTFQNATPDSIRTKMQVMQSNQQIPLFMAVDEEGGTVCRVSAYSQFRDSKFKSPRTILSETGMEGIEADCAEKSDLLLSLGINMNLGPVCDVTGEEDAFMYSRSAASDAETVSLFAEKVVDIMNNKGIAGALKHFPGYGDNQDTHTQIVYDERSLEQFISCDFLPFQRAIDTGAKCILVSHSIVKAIDPDLPATLSPEIHRILRQDMGFEGVIMTDDMSMGAITDYTNGENAAVQAVLAGNDLICCSDFETMIPAVLAAVEDGTIPREAIDESVLRILEMKLSLGIIQ